MAFMIYVLSIFLSLSSFSQVFLNINIIKKIITKKVIFSLFLKSN